MLHNDSQVGISQCLRLTQHVDHAYRLLGVGALISWTSSRTKLYDNPVTKLALLVSHSYLEKKEHVVTIQSVFVPLKCTYRSIFIIAVSIVGTYEKIIQRCRSNLHATLFDRISINFLTGKINWTFANERFSRVIDVYFSVTCFAFYLLYFFQAIKDRCKLD